MSVELVPSQLRAYQRFLGLYIRLKEEKPSGEELGKLTEELLEAQITAFLTIPASLSAKNVTSFRERVKNIFRGVAQR